MRSAGLTQKIIQSGMGGAVLTGLLITQALSTASVYFSNLQLHHKITALQAAGYLTVPGPNTLPPLTSIPAAFWGGLFFTLTAGAVLSLIVYAGSWIYRTRSRVVLVLLLLIWFGLLYLVNADGWTLFGSLFFLLVPPVVFYTGGRGSRQDESIHIGLVQILSMAPILLLAIFWFTRMDARLFENIRDHLLLTNPVGTAVNDFYYRYTLYPAEVFKPISHKTLRTAYLKGAEAPDFHKRLSALLRSHDYLVIDEENAADLIVEKKDGELVLLHGRRRVMTAQPGLFSSDPQTVLVEFSRRIDRSKFFRVFTFYGILIGFPILLYLCFLGLLRVIFGFFLSPTKATLIAAACCLAAGMAAWIPIYQAGRVEITADNLPAAIRADSWRRRVAALRYIEERALPILRFPAYKGMLKSPHVQERYWLARAMAAGRDRDSFQALLSLLKDPHPNVVCQALYALGRRRDNIAISSVIQTIKTSDSWYVQRYGYNPLRNLGWQQPAST